MPATEPTAESRIANGIVHGLQIALTLFHGSYKVYVYSENALMRLDRIRNANVVPNGNH
jgi:hypothetical protein